MRSRKGLGDVRTGGLGAMLAPQGLGSVMVAGGEWDDLPPHMLIGSNLGAEVGTIPLPMAAGGRSIRAYHGSPHDFDEFRSDKIGTGEGAQAYGHGLYFAQKEGVAKDYRNKLSGDVPDILRNGQRVTKRLGDDEQRIVDLMRSKGVSGPELAKQFRQHAKMDEGSKAILRQSGVDPDQIASKYLRDAEVAEALSFEPKGRMYEVNIKADPEHFLDWDKPLSEQAPGVRSIMESQGYSSPTTALPPQYSTVGYGASRSLRDPAEVERLKEAGIPGIKYLDAGSRGAGDGSRNFVVFDPKIIEIVRKYGIGAVLGAGLISEEMAKQMQEQGL